MNAREPKPRDLDSIIESYLEALAKGEKPDRDALLTEHPEHAVDLGQFFENYHGLEVLVEGHTRAQTSRVQLREGEQFGNYEILHEISRGGMGVVFKARQSSPDRTVALKLILSGQLASKVEIARFRREADAAARLDHPSIVSIYEIGEHEGLHFISMQYVGGGSLAQHDSWNSLAPKRAAELVEKISRAVHFAHERDVLHRDLKPENILIDETGEPLISDFGLAKRLSDDANLTQTGALLGTPAYMAPEQLDAGSTKDTPQTDVYGLGIILYKLLSGRSPFTGGSNLEILERVKTVDPRRLREVNSKIPVDLETICLKCLEKDPTRRYSGALAVAEELRRFVEQRPIRARKISRFVRGWRVCRRNATVSILIACIGLTLIAAVVVLWRAQQNTLTALRKSHIDQVRFRRGSGLPGQRIESLKILRKAAETSPGTDIRDEVVACLALRDLEEVRKIELYGPEADDRGKLRPGSFVALDSSFSQVAYQISDDKVLIRSLRGTGRQTISVGAKYCLTQFSPNDRYLAIRYGDSLRHMNRLRVYQITETPVLRLDLWCGGYRRSWDFHPDGQKMAIALQENAIGIYDLASGELTRKVRINKEVLHHRVRYRPGADEIAVGVQGRHIELVSLETGTVLEHFRDTGTLFEWDPAGESILSRRKDMFRIDVDTGASHTLETGSRTTMFALHPDRDVFATSGHSEFTYLRDKHSGQPVLRLRFHRLVHFSGDGQFLATVDSTGDLVIWRVHSGNPWSSLARLQVQGAFSSIAVSDDAALVAVGTENGAFVMSSGQRPIRLTSDATPSVFIEKQTGDLLTWGASGLYRWPIKSVAVSAREIGPPTALGGRGLGGRELGGVAFAARASNGFTIAGIARRRPRRVMVFDPRTPDEVVEFVAPTVLEILAVSPDGSQVAAAGRSGPVVLWDTATRRCRSILNAGRIFGLAFPSDDRRLLVTRSRSLLSVDLDTLRMTTFDSPEQWRFKHQLWVRGFTAILENGRDLYLQNSDAAGKMTRLSMNRPISDRIGSSASGRFLVITGSRFSSPTFELVDLEALGREVRALGLDWDLPPFPDQVERPTHVTLRVNRGFLGQKR